MSSVGFKPRGLNPYFTTSYIVAVSSDGQTAGQTAGQSLLRLPIQLILKSCKLVIMFLLKKIQFSGRKYLI